MTRRSSLFSLEMDWWRIHWQPANPARGTNHHSVTLCWTAGCVSNPQRAVQNSTQIGQHEHNVFRGEPQTSESGSVPSICRHHAFVMWRRFHGRREVLKERGLDELSAHPSWTIVTQSMWSLKCHLPRMKKHHIFCIYTHFLGNLLAHPGNRYIVC